MSGFLPTTHVSIMRGSTVNQWNDDTDTDTVIDSGLPAAVAEGVGGSGGGQGQVTFLPSSGRGGVVEQYTIRLRPRTDVEEGDRLLDERTGAVYRVESVFSPQAVVMAADVRVIATRTGARSQPVNG
jgi:hypothetical protein